MSQRIFLNRQALGEGWAGLRPPGGPVVFTNGCFDILHAGHVTYLEEARALGAYLVLGLNGDASISRLKGAKRPIVPFEERAIVMAGLQAVDLVVGFEEDTPLELIEFIQPDTLVKGGDWKVEQIVGSSLVLQGGGSVRSLSFKQGSSTTDIIETVMDRYR